MDPKDYYVGEKKNGLEIRILKMHEIQDGQMKRHEFGNSNDLSIFKLIVVGETGSGKTTFINSLVNNIFGVDYYDKFRYSIFKLNNMSRSESESQTDLVTEYTFNYIKGMKRKCNFVIVDTPGLEDTRGVDIQNKNIQHIHEYISEHPSQIGFTIHSSTNRLAAKQKSVLLELKDMIKSGQICDIIILSTFADSDSPSVKNVLDGFDIPYSNLFLFNNNALFSRNKDIPNNDLKSFKMNWEDSNRSMNNLLDFMWTDVKAHLARNIGQNESKKLSTSNKIYKCDTAMAKEDKQVPDAMNMKPELVENVTKTNTIASENASNKADELASVEEQMSTSESSATSSPRVQEDNPITSKDPDATNLRKDLVENVTKTNTIASENASNKDDGIASVNDQMPTSESSATPPPIVQEDNPISPKGVPGYTMECLSSIKNKALNFFETRKDESSNEEKEKRASENKQALKNSVKKNLSTEVKGEEVKDMKIRKLNTKVLHRDMDHNVQKLSIGIKTNKPNKVILLVGATGAGKTTLINTMANYIYNVDFSDNFRFIIIDDNAKEKKSQANSQTDLITAYFFYHQKGMPFDYNYIIIDTPGFGDTGGIERDRKLMNQLGMFFNQSYGIDSLDCVGFVTPSTAIRLTPTQQYIYDGISSMFGIDIKANIYVMVTFADGNKPPVLEGLKKAKVDFVRHFKFNNSSLNASNKGDNSSDNSDDDDSDSTFMAEGFWKIGQNSMKKFFNVLGKIEPASLVLTKEVLKERSKLETTLNGLQDQIHLGVGKIENLQHERDTLDRFDDDMKGSADYEITTTEPKLNEIKVPEGTHTTTCSKCFWTCHRDCAFPNNDKKKFCTAMSSGYCTTCPLKCHWTSHYNYNCTVERIMVEVTHTLQEKLDRYKKAEAGKLNKEDYVRAIEADIHESSEKLKETIKMAQKTVDRLDQIALKPNPLTSVSYIDLLIGNEKNVMANKFEERIKLLNKIRKDAIFLQNIQEPQLTTSIGAKLYNYIQEKYAGKNSNES